jgi:LPPG:FO 2-phospho-L-lactate transferase
VRAVVLAGGTGGAKLAAGMQELLGEELSVIVNTGDDAELLGVHVSPDPDLVTYWLTGEIDEERGWGIRSDSFTVFERLVELGAPSWFGLSDRDLAVCLRRRVLLDAGERQTEAQASISRALGARAQVLPMCDEPVRTRVRIERGWVSLQEFLVAEHARPEVLEVELDGIAAASPSAEVAGAIAAAKAIVVGPSNPVISIGPILAVPGMRELIRAAAAPVVAVSPYVAGKTVKGPTDAFMRAAGHHPSATGVAALYGELLDGFVVDSGDPASAPDDRARGEHRVATNAPQEPAWPQDLARLEAPTLMDSAASRRALAETVLNFAASLG